MNPKGLGLFLGAVSRVPARPEAIGGERLAERLISLIAQCGIADGTAIGWGYPFPWQSRSFWAPVNTPNAVVTATVGWHTLKASERFSLPDARRMGVAAAEFLATRLNITESRQGSALSYTALDRTQVVNVSALAARVLVKAALHRSDGGETELSGSLLRFVLATQRPDGSWPYAASSRGQWEDSFHTGYVLESLLDLREMGMKVPDEALERGLSAYARFFTPVGAARLWPEDDRVYDSHSAAQGVLTYAAWADSTLGSSEVRAAAADRAQAIANWALGQLWLPDKGYFAYRITRGRRDEREFLRWVTAWMALAMATAEGLSCRESEEGRDVVRTGAETA